MCGIAGELSLDGATSVDPAVLARMGDALAHRGPDGEESFRDGPVGLAFRPLALVDVAHGAQPVRSEDGGVVAIVNGELYDHRAHRATLRARGHAFASGSDAEVVVHLYEEHGPAFVERLRGMFALALWDARDRRTHEGPSSPRTGTVRRASRRSQATGATSRGRRAASPATAGCSRGCGATIARRGRRSS